MNTAGTDITVIMKKVIQTILVVLSPEPTIVKNRVKKIYGKNPNTNNIIFTVFLNTLVLFI
jgi:hypothetical protein